MSFAGFFDLDASTFKRWLASLGPGFCRQIVLPLRNSQRLSRHGLLHWHLTTANGMTVTGLELSFLGAAFLLCNWKVAGLAAFLLSRPFDIFDGWVAHNAPNGNESPVLDSTADKLGLFATFLALWWVVKHPSPFAWVCVVILLVIDAGNMTMNWWHKHLADLEARRNVSGAASSAAMRVKSAANSVKSGMYGKGKTWAMSFMAAILIFIDAIPEMRSYPLWVFFRFTAVLAIVFALLSLSRKVQDMLAYRRLPRSMT